MIRVYKRLTLILILGVAFASPAVAQLSNAGVTPGEATANSVWNLRIIYKEQSDKVRRTGLDLTPGVVPDTEYPPVDLTKEPLDYGIIVEVDGSSRTIHMYPSYEKSEVEGGRVYRGACSAGLNMSNINQQPLGDQMLPDSAPNVASIDNMNTLLLRDPRGNPLWYAPWLVSEGKLPKDRRIRFWVLFKDKPGNPTATPPVPPEPVAPEKTDWITVTVHSSSPMAWWENNAVDYAGSINRDKLLTYPGKSWPSVIEGPDPLHAIAASGVAPVGPTDDDGASSAILEFRVRYKNEDNLPPRPWMYSGADEFDGVGGRYVYPDAMSFETGVVLYLDVDNVFDLGADHTADGYRPHFMRKVDPTNNDYTDGVDYMYRVMPFAEWRVTNATLPFYAPAQEISNNYMSLMVGAYHYFFGCTDDTLSFDELMDGRWYYSYVGDHQDHITDPNNPNAGMNNWTDWGNTSYTWDGGARQAFRSSSMLDPCATLVITPNTMHAFVRHLTDSNGNPYMPREVGRRYSSTGISIKDNTLYVDRTDNAPGRFEDMWIFQYPLPCTEHPISTIALNGFGETDDGGFGFFMGTLKPYQRAVNPLITDMPNPETGFNAWAQRSETAGVTSAAVVTFRIKVYRPGAVPPRSVKVYIANNSYKVIDSNQPLTLENGGYVGYVMKVADDQTSPGQSKVAPYDYSLGVDYDYKTQLPAGPHTYFFAATDENITTIYPSRPEDWLYNGQTYYDAWLPSYTNAGGDIAGYDNNYFAGPYVNHPCQLSGATVTPTTGTQGQNYVYRVFYKDADGQRPYQAVVYIETGTDAGVLRCNMVKENPMANDYVTGAWYVMNSGAVENFALAKGLRHYRFEFVDDWGRQSDVNDVVRGETTYYPADGGWVDGPTISDNYPPTLRVGKAESADGTSNGATMWKFSVRYTDRNNDAPKYVVVYIGQEQDDPTTGDPVQINWDGGHDMTKADVSNVTYNGGVDYVYQTRLLGAQAQGDPEPVYWYAFEAADSTNNATWIPADNLDVDARSESAGCLMAEKLQTSDNLVYRTSKKPTVGTLPFRAGILTDPIVWLYPGGDANQKQVISRKDTYVIRATPMSTTTVQRYDAVDPVSAPPISSVLHVYLSPYLTGTDYFDDGKTKGTYSAGTITLIKQLPVGVEYVWVVYSYSAAGSYTLDRLNGTFTFTTAQKSSDEIRADYFFATKMNTPVGANLPPTLTNPKLSAVVGGSNTDFVYTVMYRETEGTNGQAPTFMRVVIDGNPHDMTSTVTGAPSYKAGVIYRYSTKLSGGSHNYYFETSDGVGLVVLQDYDTANSRPKPFDGPWINDAPKLSNGVADPNPTGDTISPQQAVTYTVTFTDTDNDAPVAGTPILYVDDANEMPVSRAVVGLTADTSTPPKYRSLRMFDRTGQSPNYSSNLYASKTLTFTGGPLVGRTYTIASNQGDTVALTFATGDLLDDVRQALSLDSSVALTSSVLNGSTFTIEGDNSVVSLVADAAEPSKYRAIKVLDDEGQSPNFTADQYAGKLLQFTSPDSPLYGRVFLIVSNSSDTLRLLTDDLSADGLTAGTSFSIGALQMFKADPAQVNYTAGVQYTLTVPNLSEGQHKFHFKAASVMRPPSWVPAPYNTTTQSAWVRDPGSSDYSGPTVAPEPPTTNHPPFLSMLSGFSPVSPASGKTSDGYAFFVYYKDDDGDVPWFHDNVLGFVRVIFDDYTFAAEMGLAPGQGDPTGLLDFFKTSKRFWVQTTGLPEGNHKFHFEASDGWAKARYPALAQGTDPTLGDPVVMVNAKAKLTNILVTPPSGASETNFVISLTYSDANGLGPTVSGGKEQVWVEISGVSTPLYLTRSQSSSNWAVGVTYSGSISQLAVGLHDITCNAIDNMGEQTTVVVTGAIRVTSNDNAPVGSNLKVYRVGAPTDINDAATGGTNDTFRYEITYSDADGNVPAVSQNGTTVEGVELYIDGKFEAIVTQRTGTDFVAGVTYTYTKLGRTYSAGAHTYQFKMKDGPQTTDHSVETAVTNGPNIDAATIALSRAVYNASTTSLTDRDPRVTETMRISGSLMATKTIAGSQKLGITVVRPDGTGESFTVTCASDNTFSFDRVPMINKTWTISARWAGDNDVYRTPVTKDLNVEVKGPTRVVATQDMGLPEQSAPAIDMICSPLYPTNGDAGTLFGFDRVGLLGLVVWDPQLLAYVRYGQGTFVQLGPGSAVWIKPGVTYPAESVSASDWLSPVDPEYPVNASNRYRLLKPFGKLWDQQTECQVQLKTGWNQIGSPYLSKTEISRVKVVSGGVTMSIDEAAGKNILRNYAWMWDPVAQTYKLIHASRPDAYAKTFDPWRGYWIRSLVDCTLVFAPPTAGFSSASISSAGEEFGAMSIESLAPIDAPPAAPRATDK